MTETLLSPSIILLALIFYTAAIAFINYSLYIETHNKIIKLAILIIGLLLFIPNIFLVFLFAVEQLAAS